MYFPRRFVFICALCAAVCPLMLRSARRLDAADSIGKSLSSPPSVSARALRAAFFALPLAVFLLKYIIYYPGGFTDDSIDQYTQTLTGAYDDWHPVLHTLLFFRLPLALSGGWAGSVVLFQILLFSGTLYYSLSTVQRCAGTRWALGALAFILLNPATGNIAMFPWKDVAFAMGALTLVTFMLRLRFTDGKWIKSPLNAAAFALVLALTSLMRHNAILFTVPFMFAAAFMMAPKRALAVCLCALALVFGVKWPLYSALGVTSPGKRAAESMGLPMNVIGAAVTGSPETLGADILEFAYAFAPEEVWRECYVCGRLNSVKWHPLTDTGTVDRYGAPKVLDMAFRCLWQAPKESIMALIKLTGVAYTVYDDYSFIPIPKISRNTLGIEPGGVPALQAANRLVSKGAALVFPWLFTCAGAVHLALLTLILAKFRLSRFGHWKRIFPALPLFSYNFGTALLLYDASDSARLFFYTFIVAPSLLVLLLDNRHENIAPDA